MNKSGHSSTANTIQSFRKRRQSRGPVMFYLLAALLVVAGVIVLVLWLTGPSKPLASMFATDTPTPTVTFTVTGTPMPTATSTETLTPTITSTATPSAPFQYTVQEGDSLFSIAEKFGLGDDGIQLILELNPAIRENGGVIFPGQIIWIPNPDLHLPTATPIPPDLPRGTKIEYTVQPGDTLEGIAQRFNSTVEAIMEENDIEDPNTINVGDVLIIPVNIVTPTATRPPSSTPGTPSPPVLNFSTSTPTGTKAP
ncbi:MAG: LysM domain-containing protein [Chloroflexota bacterium]